MRLIIDNRGLRKNIMIRSSVDKKLLHIMQKTHSHSYRVGKGLETNDLYSVSLHSFKVDSTSLTLIILKQL